VLFCITFCLAAIWSDGLLCRHFDSTELSGIVSSDVNVLLLVSVCLFVCLFVTLCMCMYVCMYLYVLMYVCIYVSIYLYVFFLFIVYACSITPG